MDDAFLGARSRNRRIGPATCTRSIPAPSGCCGTPSRIARAAPIIVLVALGNNGVNGVFQDGREAVVSSRRVSSTTPPAHELRFDDSFRRRFFSAAKTSATAHRRVRRIDATTFLQRSAARND